MKKFLALSLLIVFLCGSALANGEWYYTQEKENKAPPNATVFPCPKTLISDNDKCMTCHVMAGNKFVLREAKKDAWRNMPHGMEIRHLGGKPIVYYVLSGEINLAESETIEEVMQYAEKENINHLVMEIFSGGGGVFSGWRIKCLMDEWKGKGNIVETRLRSFAASAATIIFAAGTRGHRIANAESELMMHELYTFKLFDLATPSSKEDEAKVLRHLMDTMTIWLASRCNLTKEELDARVRRTEYWLRGKEAHEIGLVDQIIKSDL